MPDSYDSMPNIAITMGDPAGIGPEIIARYFKQRAEPFQHNCFVVGRSNVMQRACHLVGCESKILAANELEQLSFAPNSIGVLECGNEDSDRVEPAQICAAGGQLAYDALKKAAELAILNRIDAVVTAPLNKQALRLAGVEEPGHTELLARFCQSNEVAMMLHLPTCERVSNPIGLSVVHVSLHTALRNVFEEISVSSIMEKCELANQFCRSLLDAHAIEREPRIGVAALNPHGGEQGLFGREEIEIIAPAIKVCREKGIDAIGPEPCDTLMRRAALAEFDAVVAMYHDQGHIALKMLDMFSTVNVTLGLPIIRTSVAHGTAEDIAWAGTASSQSLQQAVQVAAQLVVARNLRVHADPIDDPATILR